MFAMTKWIDILKNDLNFSKTRKEIRILILKHCLVSNKQWNGQYLIDEKKIWDIIQGNLNCQCALKSLRIESLIDLYSYEEEKFHRIMWRSYRTTYRKYRR